MKKYPRVGEITTVKPQGLCALCNTVLLDGKKPEKRVRIEHNIFRGDDTVHKAHRRCIKEVRSQLLDRLTYPRSRHPKASSGIGRGETKSN